MIVKSDPKKVTLPDPKGTLLGLSDELVEKLRQFSVAYCTAGCSPIPVEDVVRLLDQVCAEQTASTGPRLIRVAKIGDTAFASPISSGAVTSTKIVPNSSVTIGSNTTAGNWTTTVPNNVTYTVNWPSTANFVFTQPVFTQPDFRIDVDFNVPPLWGMIKSDKVHMADVLKQKYTKLSEAVFRIPNTAYISDEKGLASLLYACFYINQHYRTIVEECNKYVEEFNECYDPVQTINAVNTVSVFGYTDSALTVTNTTGSVVKPTITWWNGTSGTMMPAGTSGGNRNNENSERNGSQKHCQMESESRSVNSIYDSGYI